MKANSLFIFGQYYIYYRTDNQTYKIKAWLLLSSVERKYIYFRATFPKADTSNIYNSKKKRI